MLPVSRCQLACGYRGPVMVHAQKGFGSKRGRSRSAKAPGAEADKLVGEYIAVKQGTPTTSSLNTRFTTGSNGSSSSSRPAPPARSVMTPEASSAATKKQGRRKGFGSPAKTPRTGTPPKQNPPVAKPSAAAVRSPAAPASNSNNPAPAAAAQPTPTAAAAGGSKLSVPPPLKVAGTRHEAFESTLTKQQQQQQQPGSAATQPQLPLLPVDGSTAAAAAAGGALLADSLSRLATANDDVAAAEDHVDGLATLLQDAQAMLSGLREDAAAAAATAVSSNEADYLLGIMSDLLADLTGELELVADHLTATHSDITATQQQLEAAAAAAAAATTEGAAVAPVADTSALRRAQAEAAQEQQRAAAAAAAASAAAASAAAAEEQVSALEAKLQEKEGEVTLMTQQNEQLQAQLALLKQEAEAAAAATAAAPAAAATAADNAVAANARLRGVLMTQVQCNMALLDKLGLLAQTVVGLPGLDPSNRVMLASTISQCVLAVGAAGLPEDLLQDEDAAAGSSGSSGV